MLERGTTGKAEGNIVAACAQLDREPVFALSRPAIELLRQYAWPGNVRELRNVVERAVVLCEGDAIEVEHLPPALAKGAQAARAAPDATATPAALHDASNLQGEIRALERSRIVDALEQCAGNQSQAAKILGISRTTLIARVQEFGLRGLAAALNRATSGAISERRRAGLPLASAAAHRAHHPSLGRPPLVGAARDQARCSSGRTRTT